MLLKDYLPNNCSTAGVAGLSKQIAEILLTAISPDDVIDVSDHVIIAGGSTIPILQKQAGLALIAAINEKGEKPRLVHAIRVLPQQYAVYYWFSHGRKCGVKLAARPSASPHERAIAIDIENNQAWRTVLRNHEWAWRGVDDPPHFNYRGPQEPDFNQEAIRAFQKLWNQHNPTDQIPETGQYGPKTEKRLEASPIEGF